MFQGLRFRIRRELVGGVSHERAILFGHPVAGGDDGGGCLQWVPWDNGVKLGFGTMCKSMPAFKGAMLQVWMRMGLIGRDRLTIGRRSGSGME